MEYCKECGAPLEDGKNVCNACGAVTVSKNTTNNIDDLFESSIRQTQHNTAPRTSQRNAQGASTQKTQQKKHPFYPATNEPPQKGTRYAVMSIGSYIGTFLLMGIPLINVLLVIIWSCGGCKNQNKRNYARALLILNLIVIGLCVVLYLAGFRISDTLDAWTAYLNSLV